MANIILHKSDIGVFIGCSLILLLVTDWITYEYTPIWRIEKDQFNVKEGLHHHQLLDPIITDLDGDGNRDIIIATSDCKVRRSNSNSNKLLHATDLEQLPIPEIQFENEMALSDDVTCHPIALSVGYTNNMVHAMKKVIAVVTNDWNVYLLDHQLNLLWKSSIDEKLEAANDSIIATAMISPHPIKNQDHGVVIIARFPLTNQFTNQELSVRHDHGWTIEDVIAENVSSYRAGVDVGSTHRKDTHGKSVHCTIYALDLTTGELRWKHQPGDNVGLEMDDLSLFYGHHYKLGLRKDILCHRRSICGTYKMDIIRNLPHRWSSRRDAKLIVDLHSKKKKGNKHPIFIAGFDVSSTRTNDDLAEWLRIVRIAKAANILIIHTHQSIEIYHLSSGKLVCWLPLENQQSSTLEDINNDGLIDSLSDTSELEDLDRVATSGDDDMLPPITFKSTSQNAPLINWHGLLDSEQGFNTLFMLANGQAACFNSQGYLLWLAKTSIKWNAAGKKVNKAKMILLSSTNNDESTELAAATGNKQLILLDLRSGKEISSFPLTCLPSSLSTVSSYAKDGRIDIMVNCGERFLTVTLHKQVLIWYNVALVILTMGITAVIIFCSKNV
ncbi:uncharacterized protein TRIADDRAFT_55818 [Trichoplax adhaerens]|uniref:Uncharacterized protein n=1 Tax=Trichoplax adhaerens TaxID=10228 RepID=B3RVY2_TRIAD|nr:predicted protein [Trichoplax adhaerens]EDV25576.1 predicted protein [Trichoplax adhaerens]|eukprot:XP_002111609.1 predicted protein [Trichoplax adhaerens]